MHKSHYNSSAARPSKVYFFVGDTQAHSFTGSWNQATAIHTLMTRVLGDANAAFGGAANVVWTAGNNDGQHDNIFKKQDASTMAWSDAMLKSGIVTNDLGITYQGGKSQVKMFEGSGFYMKALPALGDKSYAIVLNTNLGGSNKAQTEALRLSLEWVQSKHGAAGIVYLLGHHPSVMQNGVDIVDEQFRGMVKGVFCGHNHVAKTTTDKLFTNVGATT